MADAQRQFKIYHFSLKKEEKLDKMVNARKLRNFN